MSTKSDVTNFLQLGAKYELILTGLFDEVTNQRKDVSKFKSNLKAGLESIDRYVKEIESALNSFAKLELSVVDGLKKVDLSYDQVQAIQMKVLELGNSLQIVSNDLERLGLNLSCAQAEVKKQNLINKYFYFFIGMNLIAVTFLLVIRL